MISHSDRSVLFNLSAAAIAELGTKAAQFATIIVIARTLGPADFGIVGAAWALYQLAVPLVQTAPELVGVRNLSADRARPIHWIAVIGTIKMLLAAGAMALLVAYGMAVDGPWSRGTIQIAAQALVLFGIALSPAWATRSFQRTDVYVIPRIVQSVVFLGLAALFLVIEPQPFVVPCAEIISWLIALAIICFTMRRILPFPSSRAGVNATTRFSELWSVTAPMFKVIAHYALAGVAATAIWWMPVLVVETFIGGEAAGYVAAAVRLVMAAIVGLQLGMQVYLPVLSKHYGMNPQKFSNLVSDLLFYSSLIHLLIGGFLLILSTPIVNLIYGDDYSAAVLPVRILSTMLVIAGINTALVHGLIAADRYRPVFVFSLLGGLVVVLAQVGGVFFSRTLEGFWWGVPFYLIQAFLLILYSKQQNIIGHGFMNMKRLRLRNISAFLLER